jgi:hypothetical protein
MTYRGCLSWVAGMVKIMLVRGMGIRDISTAPRTSVTKVLKVLKTGGYPTKPKQSRCGCLETGEFRAYVGVGIWKKKEKVRLIYARCRDSGEIAAYVGQTGPNQSNQPERPLEKCFT